MVCGSIEYDIGFEKYIPVALKESSMSSFGEIALPQLPEDLEKEAIIYGKDALGSVQVFYRPI